MRDIHTWTVFLVFETNKLVAMIGLANRLGLLSSTLHTGDGSTYVKEFDTVIRCNEWFNYQHSQGTLSIYDIHREYDLCA